MLNALEIENVYGSQTVVSGLLLEHYMSNIKQNVIRFIGSTDLIGNPTDFVNTLMLKPTKDDEVGISWLELGMIYEHMTG